MDNRDNPFGINTDGNNPRETFAPAPPLYGVYTEPSGRQPAAAPAPPPYGACAEPLVKPAAAAPAPGGPPPWGPPPRGDFGAPGAVPPSAPPRRAQRRFGPAQAALAAGALLLLGVFGLLALGFFVLASSAASLFAPAPYYASPPADTFSVVQVSGAIQNAGNDPYSPQSPGYCHDDTVAYIKQLAEDEGNLGVLLYMNTPGGGVYESDELYLALQAYREATDRPVWVYMGNMCASGGYYVAAAADYIVSNRNTTTGSIGVYIAMTDTSGLYGKLGIEAVLVKSGENKGAGTSGVPITDAQREVYQSVVDEAYEQFIAIVAEGRDMDLDEVRELADGRIYTGAQALDLGLVDELGDWDAALAAFEEETGGKAYWAGFSRQSQIARILGGLLGALPSGDAEALLDEAAKFKTGVPMALYTE